MNSMYDVRKLLKRFGIYIYTGCQVGDLEIMSDELKQLYEGQLISIQEYQLTQLIIRKELRYLSTQQENS